MTALYRITQEALRNVVKHAGKTHVKVMLEGTASGIHLEILDLGRFGALVRPVVSAAKAVTALV